MRYFQICMSALALFIVTTPGFAINKCTGHDGKVSFQDAQCVGGKAESFALKPSAGVSAQQPSSAAEKPQSETQRLEAQVEASVKKRRLYDLQNVDYPIAIKMIDQHRISCESEQVKLKSGQFAYVQNLYGKTHAAQMASEMAAASSRCDLKDRQLKEQADGIKAECVKLGGCKS